MPRRPRLYAVNTYVTVEGARYELLRTPGGYPSYYLFRESPDAALPGWSRQSLAPLGADETAARAVFWGAIPRPSLA